MGTSTHFRSSSGEFSKLKTAKTEVSKRFATAIQLTPRGSQNYVRRSATKLFSLRADGKKSNDAVSPAHIWCRRAPHVFFALAQTHTQRFVMHLRDGLLLRNLWFPRALSLRRRRLSEFSEFTVCSHWGIFKLCL